MRKVIFMMVAGLILSTATSCSDSIESDADKMADLACKATSIMFGGNVEDPKVAEEFQKLIKDGEVLKAEMEKKYTGEEWTKFQALVDTKIKECQK